MKPAFLGRCSQCGAGGHSTSGTGPESTLLRATSGAGGAGLRSSGDGAGEERG